MTDEKGEVFVGQESWTPPQQRLKHEQVHSGGGGLMVGAGYILAVAMVALFGLAFFLQSLVLGILGVVGSVTAACLAFLGGVRLARTLRSRGS